MVAVFDKTGRRYASYGRNMRTLTSDSLANAWEFMQLNARLIDRHRFAFHFRDGAAGPVRSALAPYRNDDGGFGNGLEPDLRGTSSQPVPAQHALEILLEIGASGDPMITGICDHLAAVTAPDGGVPFVLPTVGQDPRAPWWRSPGDPPGSINPTAALAGLLYRHRIDHPWPAGATTFCWSQLETLTETTPYDARAILRFLDAVPDRERAEKVFASVREPILATVTLDLRVTEDAHHPLDFAPEPGGFGRRLFTDALIEEHLDALADGQLDDGGWTVNWYIWTPIAEPEWRGWMTVERLRTLRAYGRL